jgi:hypothetical protein
VPGSSLSTEINWTWFFAFLGSTAILAVVTYAFRGMVTGLVVGRDGRSSTSKTQVLLWTYAVVFALLALLVGWVIVEVGQALSDNPDFSHAELGRNVADKFTDFVKEGLDESYLLLLGLPLGAAISSKAITTNKESNGTVVKSEKADTPPEKQTNPVAELVTDDEGNSDLGDFQYLLFNLLALGYFLSQFLIHPANGLPEMPDTLVALTSLSAGAYVAKKGVYRDPPILSAVSPPAAAPGDRVDIFGSRLLGRPPTDKDDDAASAATLRSAIVQFGRTVAQPLKAEGDVELTDEHICVRVPARLTPGSMTVKVVRPPGATSEELPFEVVKHQPTIESVVPSKFSSATATQVTVSGAGFLGEGGATDQNALTIGGYRIATTPEQWSPGRVVADVPAGAVAPPGSYPLVVHDSAGRASEPQMVEITA